MHAYTGKHQKRFWTLIRRCAVHVLSVIRITVLDLEPNPCFLIFLNISKTTHQIVNCKIKHVIPCYKEHDTSFIWYYYAYDTSKCILDLDLDLCQNFLFFVTSSILHIETCMMPLGKAVHKGFISFSYT